MRSLLGLADPTNDMSLSPIESSPYDRLALPLVNGDLFIHALSINYLCFIYMHMHVFLNQKLAYLIESVSSIGLAAKGSEDVLPANTEAFSVLFGLVKKWSIEERQTETDLVVH